MNRVHPPVRASATQSPEHHLFILWEHARREQTRILDRLGRHFDLRAVFGIQWSPARVASNFTRFYGQNLPPGSFKEEHCGRGRFLAVVVRDPAPAYESRPTSKGDRIVNVNTFDLKQLLREWTGGGHRVHATDSEAETRRDLTMLMGLPFDAILQRLPRRWNGRIQNMDVDLVGAAGWKDLRQLFAVLNDAQPYLVMRNFEVLPDRFTGEDHGDIDLLTTSTADTAYVLNAHRVFPEPHRVHYAAMVGGRELRFDLREVGDGYYDEAWQRAMLSRRRRTDEGLYVPSPEDHFYGLLYHALVHKRAVAPDYATRLARLGTSLGVPMPAAPWTSTDGPRRVLVDYLTRAGYSVRRPSDSSVYFDAAAWPDAAVTPKVAAEAVRASDLVGWVSGLFDKIRDLSSASPELHRLIADARARSLLDPAQANLVRPVAERVRGRRVLAMGARSSARVRWLAETAGHLTIVEPAAAWADLARKRCRDLANVRVRSNVVPTGTVEDAFDVVLMVDGLGCIEGADDFDAALRIALSMLAPSGILVAAVDNRLSVQRLCGTPATAFLLDERPALEDGATELRPARPRLGRAELSMALARAGLKYTGWYLPLAGVDNPSLVLTWEALSESPDMLHNVLGPIGAGATRDDGVPLALAYRALVDNQLLADLGAGFLVVAGADQDAPVSVGDDRVFLWSTERRPDLCKEVRIVRSGTELLVKRKSLFAGGCPPWMTIPDVEALLPGELLFNRLLSIVTRPGWGVADLAAWLSPLHELLAPRTRFNGSVNVLPGELLDATPFNLVGDEGGYRLFDLEWSPFDEVDLDFVLWRGVYHSLARFKTVATPAPGTPLDVVDLAAQVVVKLVGRAAAVDDWLRVEKSLQERVTAREVSLHGFHVVLRCRDGASVMQATGMTVVAAEPRPVCELRLAAVVHLFYPELWSEFAEAMAALPPQTQVFVTAPHDKLAWVRRIVKTDRPAAVVVGVDNRGRDLGPLVTLLASHDLERYDYVLKLHSKRSPHLGAVEDDRWRRALLQSLLPPDGVPALLDALERAPDAGVVGPASWLAQVRQVPGFEANLPRLRGLARRIGFEGDPTDALFVAGAMFWVRGAVLAQLKACGLRPEDFEPEAGQLDGTLAHALERAFGMLAGKAGMRVSPLPVTTEVAEATRASHGPTAPLQRWLEARRPDPAQAELFRSRLATTETETGITVLVLDHSNDAAAVAATCDSLTRAARLLPAVKMVVVHAGTHNAPGEDDRDATTVAALNAAAQAASTTWLLMVRAGETFTESGLVRVALDLVDAAGCRAVFTDALVRAPDGGLGALFRPACNLDMVLSFPAAMVRHVIVRRSEWLRLGGLDSRFGGALELDLVLRMFEDGGLVGLGHVAEPLAEIEALDGRENADETAALLAHLHRRGYERARVTMHQPRRYRIDYGHADQPLVSIIVPTKDQLPMLRRCVESLLQETSYPNYELLIVDNASEDPDARAWLDGVAAMGDSRIRVLSYPHPFNFSAINNMAAREARGDYLLLLNNDTAVIDADWLQALLNHAQRPEVGIVGAKLLLPSGRIQHAGVVLGLRGPAEHAFIDEPGDAQGYMQRLTVDQNYSAVTAACMMIRREVYEAVGGMDEQSFGVSYNDVDLCLKVGAAGYLTVWTPHAVLMHEGSVSQNKVDDAAQERKRERFSAEQDALYARWLPQIARDPAYNCNLSLTGRGFEFEADTALTLRSLPWRPQPVVLAHPADRFGSGEYRVLQPMQALREARLIDGVVRDEPLLPAEVARLDPDVVVLQRQIGERRLDAMRRLQAFSRAFKVYELDDYLPNLPLKSAFRQGIPKDAMRSLRRGLGYVDRFVVSTPALAEAFEGLHADIRVVKNRLWPAWWDGLRCRRRRGAKPRVGWAGGAGHGGDLELIVDVVKELADEVEWVFFGMCPEPLLDVVQEVHAGVAIDRYPAKLASLDLDLGLAPLEENLFNECKSNLRLIEYGACGIPVICSDLRCYREDGLPVTRVKNRFREWVGAIRAHTNDLDEAARLGDILRARVQADWMLRDEHLRTWLEAWTQR